MLFKVVKVVVAVVLTRLLLSYSQIGQSVENLVIARAGQTWGDLVAFLISAVPFALGLTFLFPRCDDGRDATGDGRLVMISGCDSGIGNLAAKTLHAKGYKVVAGCLTPKGLEDLERECPGVIAFKCDVTKDQDMVNIAAKVRSLNGGKLHAVVNNAGIARGAEVLVQDISDYENTLNVNLMGSIRFTKAALPMLIDTPGSRVVFMSSVCGLVPLPSFSSYAASKHGIEGFASVLQAEMDVFGVQVTILNPSSISTTMLETSNEDYIKCHSAAPPEAKELYGQDYIDKVIASRQRENIPSYVFDTPDVVVEDLCRAVGAKKTQIRYLSGRAAKSFFRLAHIFPSLMRSLNHMTATANPPAFCSRK